jgi:hypothetical protein
MPWKARASAASQTTTEPSSAPVTAVLPSAVVMTDQPSSNGPWRQQSTWARSRQTARSGSVRDTVRDLSIPNRGVNY